MSLKVRSAENNGEETWSSYMLNLYATRTKPVLGTYYMDKLEQLAREKLKDNISTYRARVISEMSLDLSRPCRRCIPLRLRECGGVRDSGGQYRRALYVQTHTPHAS